MSALHAGAHAHPHAHGHAHDDGHAHSDHGPAHGAPLVTALVVTLAIAALELGGGIVAHSLALMTDSAHVLMDAVALGIAAAAAWQARRPATARHSYGFARVEILAALGNGALLLAVTALVVVEAIRRLAAPEEPSGGIMLGVAAVGLVLNVGLGLALLAGARDNLNVRGALFHVASDAVGAIAVAIGGAFVLATHAAWIDPALSLLVAAIIVVGVVRIVREAADILLESVPQHMAIDTVRERIRSFGDVSDVHDLHVWTIGSGHHVLSAHVLLPDARISEASAILREIDRSMRHDFGISHVTIQFECESCGDDDKIICTQVPVKSGEKP